MKDRPSPSSYIELPLQTQGERFYDLTSDIRRALSDLAHTRSGILHLFTPHTSCGLCIGEAFDPSAREDMERFLKHIAPRNAPYIVHRDEGEDDSPSHMKSILLHPSLAFIVDQGELVLGTWQGIYLAEFRDAPKARKLWLKFVADPV